MKCTENHNYKGVRDPAADVWILPIRLYTDALSSAARYPPALPHTRVRRWRKNRPVSWGAPDGRRGRVRGAGRTMATGGAELAARVLGGCRASLARAVTLAESRAPRDAPRAAALMQALAGAGAEGFRVGLAGPPGAGKSTLVEALGLALVGRGTRTAVLAVDPSSERSGGSLLGDKTRMPQLGLHELAYVRPAPTAGVLGGVARATADSVAVCEAAGFQQVLVETVGVGQSETLVQDLVDVVVLVLPPAGGDELQGLKKGIVEAADVIAVNKADGDLERTARQTSREYRSALQFQRPRRASWMPRVHAVSARTGAGLQALWESIEEARDALEASGELQEQRRAQRLRQMRAAAAEEVVERLWAADAAQRELAALAAEVAAGSLAARAAATRVAAAFCAEPGPGPAQ